MIDTNMRPIFSIFLVLILFSVSVLGLILMNHDLLGHGGCVASISAKAMPCAEKADLINYIILHGDFLKKFTAPVFVSLILLLAGLAFATLVLFRTRKRPDLIFEKLEFDPPRFGLFDKIKFLSNKDFLSWLSFSQSIYLSF